MKQPQVIAIVADDLGREMFAMYRRERAGMERYGNAYTSPFPYPQLPNLDALASNGVSFTSCVVTPICSSTRAAALTGLYSFQSGLGSLVRGSNAAAPTTSPSFTDLGKQTGPTIRSIAHHAKANGYHCLATGKWHLFLSEKGPDFGSGPMHPTRDMGFDRWDGTPRNPQPNYTTYIWYEWDAQAGAPVMTREKAIHLTQKTSQVASSAFQEALASHPGTPIFHWIAFNAAHAAQGKFDFPPGGTTQHHFGTVAPPDSWSNTRIRATLEHLDFWIGQFFASIGYDPTAPTEDDPVVFFWGDNGTDTSSISDVPGTGGQAPWPSVEPNYPAGHPGWASTGGAWSGVSTDVLDVSPYESNHFKGFVYVDGTTVPLIFAGNPEHVKRTDKVDDSMLDVVDFFPTLAEIMRAPAGARATGTIEITGIPAQGDTLTLRDGFGGSTVFEWTVSGSARPGNHAVTLSSDPSTSAENLQKEIGPLAEQGELRLETSRAANKLALTNALRGHEGNQTIGVTGTSVLASRMSGGATEPPSLSGQSFAHRLLGEDAARRNFSGAGSQYAPNGLQQPREFELRSYIRKDGDHRWALLHIQRVGPEVVEFYDVGTPNPTPAQGTIRFLANLQEGDLVRIADDYRHDVLKGNGVQVVFTAKNTVTSRSDFVIGATAGETLANLRTAIDASALKLTTTLANDRLELTNDVLSYCGNDALSTNAAVRIDVVGMKGGAASDQRQTCDLNSQEYRNANGEHPAFAATVAAERTFLGLDPADRVQRTAQLLSAGVSTSATGTRRLEIRGTFRQGSTFRVFDILNGLDSRLLQRNTVTSWDLRVHDRDAVPPATPRDVLYSQLGMDPKGRNADGFEYVSKGPQTAGGWDEGSSRTGYVFRHDVDTRYFEHQVGRTYSFQYSISTPYDGKLALVLKLKCVPRDDV